MCLVEHEQELNKGTWICSELNINCQSVVKIHGAFASILDSIGCDVVTWTESWLKNNIKDNEIFPLAIQYITETEKRDRDEVEYL